MPATDGAGATTRLDRAPVRVQIREFYVLPKRSPRYQLTALTLGPDNAMWVTASTLDNIHNPIVRVLPSGKVSATFFYGGPPSSLGSIAAGSDGALWMMDPFGAIVRLTTSGVMSTFGDGGNPAAITSGPDGALWYITQTCCHLLGVIVRITTQGVQHSYDAGLPSYTTFWAITPGPDGALWFTERGTADGIGRITTDGVVTNFTDGLTPGSGPNALAAGPDGAMWFTEVAGRVGRITTQGVITEYSQGITAGEHPNGIAAGPDGAMWFTETKEPWLAHGSHAKIGRIAMNGAITEYSNFNAKSYPTAIAPGPNNTIWFIEKAANRMGRITITSPRR